MAPGKLTFLIFLVIPAIFSVATGVDLIKTYEKEEFIAQNDDSREDPEITVDFCAEVCGEQYGVVCSGNKTDKSNITCTCEDYNEVFDKTDQECKVDYCKEKCGYVKCEGNRFEEDEVKCICKNNDEDFIEEEKKCKVNYCRKVCGTGKDVICYGDEYERKREKDCSCDDDEYLFINKKCQKKCVDDDDCSNGGRCQGKEDSKLCKCQTGTTGDTCDVITDCETGKLQNCTGEKGSCEYKKGKAVCECPFGKEFNKKLSYCEVTCKEDHECEGSHRKCNEDGFCACREGYEGEDCSVITGCKDLEEKCRSILTECVFDDYAPEKAICKCKYGYKYNFESNECQDPYCYPENPCKDGECRYDDYVRTGYCLCSGEKYYNYRTHKCEDLADKCLLKKTPCGEGEICVNGECKCKYGNVNDGEECKENFCSTNPCFPNSICSANDGTCYCEEGKYYSESIGSGGRCEDAPCNFKEFRKSCPCPYGMSRKNGSDECVPQKDEELCSKDCGYGICVEKNNEQSCKCFSSIAKLNNIFYEKCILKERIFCASRLAQQGIMECSCNRQYTQANDGVTCRLRTCEDDYVKEECAAKGAECKMNWKKGGYTCECPRGYGIGDNGKCTDVCSIEKVIRACAKEDKFCYNSISNSNNLTGICSCPPTLKMVNGRCSERATDAYIIRNIPVLKERYETKSGINKALLSADLIRSMETTFDDSLLEYGYLYDYRIVGDVIECSVWINARSFYTKEQQDKVKLVPKTFSNICDDCDETAIVWPPNLILGQQGLQNATFDRLEFCSPEVKDILCGKGASCAYEKCTCRDGFKLIEFSIREIAGYTIQRCEDIDECATGVSICSENTTCVNTFGDYKCVCKEGFQKQYSFDNPETDKRNCFDMCTPSPCLKGKCSLKGKSFDCKCQSGYEGSFCDRLDDDYNNSKTEAVVVESILGVLSFAFAVACYFIKRMKKRLNSEDYVSSSRQNHNEMAERIRM